MNLEWRLNLREWQNGPWNLWHRPELRWKALMVKITLQSIMGPFVIPSKFKTFTQDVIQTRNQIDNSLNFESEKWWVEFGMELLEKSFDPTETKSLSCFAHENRFRNEFHHSLECQVANSAGWQDEQGKRLTGVCVREKAKTEKEDNLVIYRENRHNVIQPVIIWWSQAVTNLLSGKKKDKTNGMTIWIYFFLTWRRVITNGATQIFLE